MQHILVGKWSRATRARDRRGQRGSVGTDGKGLQCLLGLVLFRGWRSGSHNWFIDRRDEKGDLGGHEEPD